MTTYRGEPQDRGTKGNASGRGGDHCQKEERSWLEAKDSGAAAEHLKSLENFTIGNDLGGATGRKKRSKSFPRGPKKKEKSSRKEKGKRLGRRGKRRWARKRRLFRMGFKPFHVEAAGRGGQGKILSQKTRELTRRSTEHLRKKEGKESFGFTIEKKGVRGRKEGGGEAHAPWELGDLPAQDVLTAISFEGRRLAVAMPVNKHHALALD